MESSGVTAVATSGDAAVVAIAANTNFRRNVRIVNEGAPSGFFSVDGGTTWHRLPGTAASTTAVPTVLLGVTIRSVQVKRIASGTDLANVFVTVW